MRRSTMAFAGLLAALGTPVAASASHTPTFISVHKQTSYRPHVAAVRFPRVIRGRHSTTSRSGLTPAGTPDFSTFQFREDLPLNFNPKAIAPGEQHLRSCDHPQASICIDSRGYIVPTQSP